MMKVMAKILTFDETNKCLRAWRELNDKNALEILIISNSGLVVFFAKKYMGKGLTTERKLKEPKVSVEEAKKSLNKDLIIESENLAMIPTEWKTEVLCWEFEGNVDGLDFIVYVNAETGKEEDILIITNTPNGTLTH